MGVTVTLSTSSGRRAVVKNPEKVFNNGFLKAAFRGAIKNHIEITMSLVKDSLEEVISDAERAHKRDPVLKGTPLFDAYKMSIGAGVKTVEKNSVISSRLMDISVLDKLLPMSENSKKPSAKGWWRIYEFGSPGEKRGGSLTHGFLNLEFARKIMQDRDLPATTINRTLSKIAGRHGEGIMIDTSTKFAKAFGVTPHKGVNAIRVLQRAKNSAEFHIDSMRERVTRQVLRAVSS